MKLTSSFKNKMIRVLEAEELDLCVLTTHFRNDADLNYLKEADRRRIKGILDTLVSDTSRHAEVLKNILQSASQ